MFPFQEEEERLQKIQEARRERDKEKEKEKERDRDRDKERDKDRKERYLLFYFSCSKRFVTCLIVSPAHVFLHAMNIIELSSLHYVLHDHERSAFPLLWVASILFSLPPSQEEPQPRQIFPQFSPRSFTLPSLQG